MSLIDAAKAVLADADQPLHVTELTRRMLDRNLWATTGKTPVATVTSRLAVDIRRSGANSPFVRARPNTYGLRAWSAPGAGGDGPDAPADISPPQVESRAASTPSPILKDTISFIAAAEQVLDRFGKRQPMHYKEITKRALELGLIATAGKTPEATMYAQILTDNNRRIKRGERARFVKHGKGIVGLAKWAPLGLSAQIDAHNAAVRKQLHSTSSRCWSANCSARSASRRCK
jgi:restriction system protein